jgi:stress-induced morphogen
MMPTEAVKKMLLDAFPGAQVDVRDMTGTSDHFEIQVTSPVFAGKPLIQQHQMVHKALASEMDRGIHAVQIKTRSS